MMQTFLQLQLFNRATLFDNKVKNEIVEIVAVLTSLVIILQVIFSRIIL